MMEWLPLIGWALVVFTLGAGAMWLFIRWVKGPDGK